MIKKLGKGAQGSVFLAQDKRDGTQVSERWIHHTGSLILAVRAEEGRVQ